MSTLVQVSGCLASAVVSVCGSHSSRSTLSSAAEARVTTSSHLHNHALASPDTQAIVVQQELSVALLHSIQEWAQCGLATTAIRQLVQLELGVPFLSSDTRKEVRWCTLTELRTLLLLTCHHALLSCAQQISNLVQKAVGAKVDFLDALCFRPAVAH